MQRHRISLNQTSKGAWVGHQQAMPGVVGQCNARNIVDEQPVVGHVALQVRMRPVRAPQHAVRKMFDHTPRERNDVLIRGRAGDAQALGTGYLAPEILMFKHQSCKKTEFRALGRPPYIGAPHVVDYDGGRQRGKKIKQIRKIGCLEIDDYVPTQRGNALSYPHERFRRRHIDQPLDEVETHPANTGTVKALKLAFGDIPIHRCDASCASLR